MSPDEIASRKDAFEKRIETLQIELDKCSPNLKASDRFSEMEKKSKDSAKHLMETRGASTAANRAFNDVKERRCEMFRKAFDHIQERIDDVYKELTKSTRHPIGGSASLDLDNEDEPYLGGVKRDYSKAKVGAKGAT